MIVAHVYVEYSNMAVNKSFTYLCGTHHVSRGKRVIVNFANKEIVAFVSKVEQINEEQFAAIPYEVKEIISVIDDEVLVNEEMFSLADWMARQYVAPLISCFQAMLPAKLKPKSSKHKIKKEVWVQYVEDCFVKTQKQMDALAYIKERKLVLRKEMNQMYATQLKELVKRGAVCLVEKEAEASFDGIYEDQVFSLSEQQQAAIATMNEKDGFQTYLLHGVTGSGKSEVFLQMAKTVLQEGKQVLFLVPEIALTPQMVKRVKARFGSEVAIYHSSLNNQEKYEQYKLVAQKKVTIVVGTRSAVFMPFDHLGLIIIDEEHDQSYKQDSTPKYHTRDIAMQRAKYHNCKVILASATPSLESYARALKGVYHLVKMDKRIYGEMPNTHLIDMKDAMEKGENYILSNTLKNEISLRLQKQEQVILLLNRRGYAPILRCMDCGEVVICPHCDIALNYHKNSNELKCHICGYSEPNQYGCRKCGSKNVKYIGMGTQKLEEYVQTCFPEARIVRMDADTTQRKNAHEKLLSQFEHEGDILLGTQMIAKGLDFSNVTLVGIVNGDAMLSRSDFRSVELTFDLLAQASGRSGRGLKDGEVFIQAYDTKHYAMQCAKHHNYETFFYQEMKFRHLGNYPPYSYLGVVTLLAKEESILQDELDQLMPCLQHELVQVLGPCELLKIMDQYRWRIILKSKQLTLLCDLLHAAYKKHFASKGKATIEVDLNPFILD